MQMHFPVTLLVVFKARFIYVCGWSLLLLHVLGPSQKGPWILKAAGLQLEEEFVGKLGPRIWAFSLGPPLLSSLVL